MGDRSSTSALYSARPRLSIDGREDTGFDLGLVSMSVHESVEGLFNCEITLGNWGAAGNGIGIGYLYFDRQTIDYGRRLGIEIGSGDAAARIFDGRITGIEGRFPKGRPPEVLVLAEDRLQDLRMVRRSRTFEDVTVEDVVSQVAGAYGLNAETDLESPSYRILAQLNQSDLAFLRERLRAVDAELWVDGDTLYVRSRSRRRTGEIILTYGEGLHEFSVIADLANQRTGLSVSGWDVQAKEALDHEATGTLIRSELEGGISGSQVLKEAFGQRPERIVHLAPLSEHETRTIAESQYRRMARQFVRGQGKAEGDGRIRAGAHITLQGLGDLFNGRYYVNEVTHYFSAAEGFRSVFHVERSYIGGS